MGASLFPVLCDNTHMDKNVEIQAFWFKADYWFRGSAEEWLESNGFKFNIYRERVEDDLVTHFVYPQFPTDEGKENTFRVISNDFPLGVTATTCERKNMKQFTKGVQSANDPFEFVLSDESVDRMGDVIYADGWDLKDFQKNPVALFGHDHAKPIGVWKNVRVEGKKLLGKLQLAVEGTSAEIDTIRKLVEQRILKAVSVGFSPIEYNQRSDGGYNFIKQSLHETSLVSVPANANALAIAKSLGADDLLVRKLLKPKGQNAAPTAESKMLRDTIKSIDEFLAR